jgi:hypothetical protein
MTDLLTGEFTSTINLSNFAVATIRDFNQERWLAEQIQNIVNALPAGTEVLTTTLDANISSLVMTYTVRFFNPLMANYKSVELIYARDCVALDEKLQQFNRLVEVKYEKR